jgi:hypothetical protein
MAQDTIYGIVPNRASVEKVVQALLDAGISRDHISFLSSRQDEFQDIGEYNRNWREEDRLGKGTKSGLGTEKHTKAPEGATAGMTAGGIIGGTLGLLAGIGALAIPGVGPLIAAGPILATLSGIGAGGAIGGVIGALAGLGIPEYEAKRYGNRLKEGGILFAVQCNHEMSSRVKEILIQNKAEDVTISSDAVVSKNYGKRAD